MRIAETKVSNDLLERLKLGKGIETYEQVFRALQNKGFEVKVERCENGTYLARCIKGCDYMISCKDLVYALNRTLSAIMEKIENGRR